MAVAAPAVNPLPTLVPVPLEVPVVVGEGSSVDEGAIFPGFVSVGNPSILLVTLITTVSVAVVFGKSSKSLSLVENVEVIILMVGVFVCGMAV